MLLLTLSPSLVAQTGLTKREANIYDSTELSFILDKRTKESNAKYTTS